ncbi:hypothetical protein KIN20_004532 [Parelaphostrongylus tenuis]|uniref:Uncharacterized protein n=1 Tax=Parelaphostrongylus tenuis TaxID=148309 RepID=A0AAD5M391_PARTN|nr:hypothetical protein KIN20_004532 [Parelaphostrongylus tenuis]
MEKSGEEKRKNRVASSERNAARRNMENYQLGGKEYKAPKEDSSEDVNIYLIFNFKKLQVLQAPPVFQFMYLILRTTHYK